MSLFITDSDSSKEKIVFIVSLCLLLYSSPLYHSPETNPKEKETGV